MAIAPQKIMPCLWFDAEAEDAAKFYCSVFKHSRINDVTRYGNEGQDIHGKRATGEAFRTFAPEYPDLINDLRAKGVKIDARREDAEPFWYVLLVNWFPMLLLIGLWVFFMRQMPVGGGKAIIPSAKKLGGPGASIDVPLHFKDAAFVRSHFDAMEVRVPDAPRANEILVALAVTDGGRPHPRVGGLTVAEAKKEDGLR